MKFLRVMAHCIYRAGYNTLIHDGIEHAGYLAFLGLLALFPFLVFVFSVAGILGQGEMGATLITDALQALPGNLTAALRPRVTEIVSGPPQGLLTVSILGAIWTASSAVEGMRTILNRAYHVATPPAYWLRRSLSILQLLLFSFIVIAAMLVMVFASIVVHYIEQIAHIHLAAEYETHIRPIMVWVTVVALFLAVSFVYYLIPNIRQRFLSVAPGALLVVALWVGGAGIFTLYLSNFNQMSLIYGSLGGIIAALIFFYICNVIFIFGAEFNHQVLHAFGLHAVQREDAGGIHAGELPQADDTDLSHAKRNKNP